MEKPCFHVGDGRNRLCVHPKFLHSNATSHKWAFGGVCALFVSDQYDFSFLNVYWIPCFISSVWFPAIAELLDNAVDEVTPIDLSNRYRELVYMFHYVIQIQNGATFIKVDKFITPHAGSLALLVQGNLCLLVLFEVDPSSSSSIKPILESMSWFWVYF